MTEKGKYFEFRILRQWLKSFIQDDFQHCFRKCQYWWGNCIQSKGEYFERNEWQYTPYCNQFILNKCSQYFLITLCNDLQFHLCCGKWQDFILFYAWMNNIPLYMYITISILFIHCWIPSLIPYVGCNKYERVFVSLIHWFHFLWNYTQYQDYWIIWYSIFNYLGNLYYCFFP